jgi:hypothetical protein
MGVGASTEVENRNAIAAGCVAVLLVSANYVLFADISLNLADGGFLWYGVERTAAGEVPLRDFQSYEPGRYYWGALWSIVLGDGILALRLSTAIFQMLGLGCGMLVARRLVSHPLWLLPIGILLLLWMFPRYKFFEPALAMMAVYVAMRLLEARNLSWFFAAGVFVGVVSFIGRNHALYAGLGIFSLILWLRPRGSEVSVWTRLAVLAAGGCIGAIPLVGMMLFVPGFALSFWDSIRFFIEHGANLPAPIPWPWQVDYAGMAWTLRAENFSVGAAFLLAPVVYGVGLVVAFRSDRDPLPQQRVLIAATAIGIFYFHHAAIRSDTSHLAQAVHPMILASLAIPGALGWSRSRPSSLAIWSVVVLITISCAPHASSSFLLPWQAKTKSLVPLVVAGDELRLRPGQAQWISGIERVVRTHIREDESLFIAPYSPGLYSVLGKESPVWDLYLLWKADEEHQKEMILSLDREHVNWALISTGAIDGNDELRFWSTHERVWEHFKSQFEIVSDPMLPRGLLLFRRRSRDRVSGFFDPFQMQAILGR